MSKSKMIMLPREVVEQTLDTLNTVEWSVVESCWIVDGERIDSAINTLRAALEQPDAEPPATVPEGWKLVPVNPTKEMRSVGAFAAARANAISYSPVGTYIPVDAMSLMSYSAMLAAAPKPPALGRPQSNPVPYLYYDPANGDTWTQEAIDDGFRQPDGLIALYTK